ncbi:energy transducer TonB [Thiomonas bhubaneswarensis]|uniref:TonB family C-terminal domain n=1 Tax=Thiomonas bhubaneswarensis TaxID=339866 RepID=A0A0K6HPP5_9BURK|nr:energy transducer TonB [Thiomonas bhubaneswarensis]CUA93007.1 TonB family C-terminal domain [Thiomonas bhubaneswarensis]
MPALSLRSFSPLQWALIASIGVHVALLSLRFAAPQTFNRMFDNAPLDVVLVNQRTEDAPTKPQAIAQANLDGGGDANKGLATTPLPFTADVSHGDAAVHQQRSLSELEQKQQQLLTQVRQQIVQLAQTVRQESNPEKQQALEEKRRQLLDMLGAIERQIRQQNAKPRRRFIGPSTREAAYALYYDKLRTKIETLGTREFPQSGGNKLYGSLIMSITIAADGRLVAADVVQSSGNPTLDRQARAIVEAAQPYGRFTDAMLRQADQIVVISRFRFTRDQGLETAVQAPQSPEQAAP